ncbi:F-box/LRR-repeat protein At4g14103-like isoform X1 [Rhododendron vialii]|uniref:F-box/LRR-repeat protein At4g14103-like isoform X1 n=1 Tax=Rhododendron vialii TaxID=182163 RepID=UPI0026601D54|nr:F-box/LRR-repeat protein At4g14103-like isoform X1 [Rhododendron vialii]
MDVISSFSDNVLHHILSFLSTEDSIRTSILSRRWQYLWTSISDINLDDISWSKDIDKIKDQCPMCHRFSDFVDRVLLLHDASDIRRLHLNILDPVNSSRLNSWISAAIRHNVQELDLDLPVRTRFLLPCCLFTCESLLVLKLFMQCVLKPPSFIYLSSLKTLVFDNLTFSDDESTQHLFSNCPVLQELALMNCGWKNIKTLTISVPTLKRLTIEDDRSLWADALSCAVKVHAPNLICLKFTSTLKGHFHLCGISSLVNASIDLPHRVLSQQHASRVIGVLTGICNVKSLTVLADTLLIITWFVFLRFPNMTDLELNAEFCGDLTGGLINLLEKSPKLEFLDFAQGFDSDFIHDHEVCLMLERVPSCCCFKWFSLSYFKGKPAEMHFLRLLLKNATVLKKMTLYCEPILSEDSEKEEEVNNQLRGFPRRSESCVIELL